jgi:hypothetical protein
MGLVPAMEQVPYASSPNTTITAGLDQTEHILFIDQLVQLSVSERTFPRFITKLRIVI